MSIQELGKQITVDRKKLSMSQIQLAKGICSQSALSLIERGISSPRLEILSQLSLKLKRPISFYLQYMIEDNVNQTTIIAKAINERLEKQDYSSAFDLASSALVRLKNKTHIRSWFDQYLIWVQVISKYRTNRISFEKTISEIKKLLHDKYFLINQNKYLYYRILNSLALIYGEKEDLVSALNYYNKALKNDVLTYDKEPSIELFIQRILYNKTKTLFDLGNFEESKETAKEGIRYAKKLESLSLLGNFYYYLGLSKEKLGYDFETISNIYERAAFVFDFLDKKSYLDILVSKKKEYLNNKAVHS